MTDARTISIKAGLQQDHRLIHCNCQAAYSGDTLSQQIATIFLPGGELQGANTPIHYHCLGDASNYDVELRSLDGLTTHASRTLDNVPSTEWYVTLDTDFTVPPGGDWYTVYVTAPSTGDQLYIRGILFSIGGQPRSPWVNTVAPVASGTFAIGQVLSTTNGTWTGTDDLTGPAYTYQWYRDGLAIGGATSSTYIVTSLDVGPEVQCRVSRTNSLGTTHAFSNSLIFDDVTYLPNSIIWISSEGETLSGSEVLSWASSYGGLSATFNALSATQRPLYNATGGVGGRPIITGDGINDQLEAALPGGLSSLSREGGIVYSVASPPVTSTVILTAVDGSGNQVLTVGIHDPATTGYVRLISLSHAGFAGPAHVSCDGTTTTGTNLRKSGTVVASGGNAAPWTPTFLKALSFGGGTFPSNASLQAVYYGEQLTADQRTHLRALLTYHTGVAC